MTILNIHWVLYEIGSVFKDFAIPLILKKSIVYLQAFQWQLSHKLFDKWFRETRQTQAFWERFCFSPQFRQGKCMMVSASRHNAVLTLSSRRSKAAFKGTASFYSVLGAPVGRLYEGVFHKLPITQTQHCHHVLLFSLFIVYTSMVDCTRKTLTSVLPFLLAESKVRGNAKKGRF